MTNGIANDVSRVHIQMFEAMLFFGHYLTFTHAPGRNPALEHNGDLYCCDHYVEPGYRLGNINMTPLHTLLTDARLAAFGNDKFDTLTAQCLKSEVRAFCNGGCSKDRFAKTHTVRTAKPICARSRTHSTRTPCRRCVCSPPSSPTAAGNGRDRMAQKA